MHPFAQSARLVLTLILCLSVLGSFAYPWTNTGITCGCISSDYLKLTTTFNTFIDGDNYCVLDGNISAFTQITTTTKTLDSGEVLAPGNSIGTYKVSGNYVQNPGSTLEIEVNDYGQSDLVKVTGTATINGGTVKILPEWRLYSDEETYTILTATGGVTGTFDSITSFIPFYQMQLIYNSYNIQLLVERDYTTPAQTSNQRSVGNYLNHHSLDSSIFYPLSQITTPEKARDALESLSGEPYGSLSTVGIENTSRFLQILSSRLRSRSLGQRFVYAAPVPQETAGEEGLVFIRGQNGFGMTRSGWNESSWNTASQTGPSSYRPLPWAEGYGIAAQLGSDGNAGGLDYSTGGTVFGLERNLNPSLLLGVVGGYNQTGVRFDRLHDWSEINSAQVGIYLQHDTGSGYATGIAAYGYNAYEVRRHILPDSLGAYQYESRKEYTGSEFSFYLETGRNFYFPVAYLQPFVALQYIQLHQNQIHENDADTLSLQIKGIHADSFRGLLGLRAVRDVQLPGYRLLSLEGRALWRHEFLDEARLVDAQFVGIPGSTFIVEGLNVDRDVAILGGGLTFCLSSGTELYANYDLLISENYTAHSGTGGLMLVW